MHRTWTCWPLYDEVGVARPETGIFRAALERVECSAEAAVMVGDFWESDVAGARVAGIRAVWFNRRGFDPPDASPVSEIKSLEPLREVLGLLPGGRVAV